MAQLQIDQSQHFDLYHILLDGSYSCPL